MGGDVRLDCLCKCQHHLRTLAGIAQQQLVVGVAEIACFEKNRRRVRPAKHVKCSETMRIRAQLDATRGFSDQAVRKVRRSAHLGPHCEVSQNHALVATEDPKNYIEAKTVLKEAVNRDNEDPFAWYQLGIIYDQEGDTARAALATAERSNLENNPKLAYASAQTAMKGIPAGTPDYLRAQDIAMVSRAELAEKDKKYRDEKELRE